MNDLYRAVTQGTYEQVLELLEKGIYDINSAVNGDTMLYIAAQKGKTDIVELLLSYGADINRKNCVTIAPLLIAAENGHKDTVACLLKHRANPNIQCGSGRTCLHFVKNIEIATLFLDVNCDLTLIDKFNQTAKQCAFNNERRKIANLIEQYDDPSPNQPEKLKNNLLSARFVMIRNIIRYLRIIILTNKH